jgi:hypothetical protein
VPRLAGKFVINSRWLFKIKHVIHGSIEKYKAIFVVRRSLKERELTMKRLLLQVLSILLLESPCLLHQFLVGLYIRWT